MFLDSCSTKNIWNLWMKLIFGCTARILWKHFLRITHPMLRSMIFFRVKGVTSDFDRFFDVSAWDSGVCYSRRLLSKCFICLSNPLNCTRDCSFGGKKFLKIKVVEELFEINYVIRKVKWLGYVHHREEYLRHYWSRYRPWWFCIKKCPNKYLFIRSSGYDGVLFFFKVIVLILEVQIYCSFSLRCFSLSIIIRHIKLKIYYWICFPYTSKISLYILKFYGLEGPSRRVRQRALEIVGPALVINYVCRRKKCFLHALHWMEWMYNYSDYSELD